MDHWPLFGLRVRTSRLELRYPDDALLVRLLEVARGGVHDPGVMPFSFAWTRRPPGRFEPEFLQHHWGVRAGLSVDDWTLPLVVLADGEVLGVQDLAGRGFRAARTCVTGSWVGLAHQGRGIGTEMRAAALELAFAHLGAELCQSAAWHDNAPSIGVSRRLGYADDGWELRDRDGEPTRHVRFRLHRADWRPPVAVTVEGLEACLPLLLGDR